MSQLIEVKVYVNRNKERFRRMENTPKYQTTDVLEMAIDFKSHPPTKDHGHMGLLEKIYMEFNMPFPQGMGNLTPGQVRMYHRKFPSMSVGDVIVLDDGTDPVAYYVESLGFQRIPDSTVKFILLAERFNEWQGINAPVSAQMIGALTWSMSMDDELYESVKRQVESEKVGNVIAMQEADAGL
jgi:hypothetical protein